MQENLREIPEGRTVAPSPEFVPWPARVTRHVADCMMKGNTMNRQVFGGFGAARRAVLIAGLSAMVWLAAGCARQTANILRPPLDPSGETDLRMILGPGDEVEIRFFYTPTLDITQTVRPDGMISMLLVGEVRAAALTPVELEQALKGLYKEKLRDPDINVVLKTQWSRRAYVGGMVVRPGPVSLPAPTTVVEAIMQVGGPRIDYAELKNVLVIRPDGMRRKIGSINLASSFGLESPSDGQTIEAFYLKPGDIVYVPQTRIVEINRWLDQHIHDPFLGAGVRASLGNVDLLYSLGGARGTESW
jgi:protein involved in polysaccharide export with SLBB domain